MPRKKKAAQPADSQESRTVTIYAEILQPTDSAVLIRCGESELWLPADTGLQCGARGYQCRDRHSRMAGGRKGTVRR